MLSLLIKWAATYSARPCPTILLFSPRPRQFTGPMTARFHFSLPSDDLFKSGSFFPPDRPTFFSLISRCSSTASSPLWCALSLPSILLLRRSSLLSGAGLFTVRRRRHEMGKGPMSCLLRCIQCNNRAMESLKKMDEHNLDCIPSCINIVAIATTFSAHRQNCGHMKKSLRWMKRLKVKVRRIRRLRKISSKDNMLAAPPISWLVE